MWPLPEEAFEATESLSPGRAKSSLSASRKFGCKVFELLLPSNNFEPKSPWIDGAAAPEPVGAAAPEPAGATVSEPADAAVPEPTDAARPEPAYAVGPEPANAVVDAGTGSTLLHK